MPAWEAVKALGTATSLAIAQGGASASNTVHHGGAAPRSVCIEFNAQTPVGDFVPSLQRELQRHGVDSRVYRAGEGDPACLHWLRYTAVLDYEQPMWSREYRGYLRHVQLVLQQGDGRVLSSSQYQADGVVAGQWASTQQKLQPVVTALLGGAEG